MPCGLSPVVTVGGYSPVARHGLLAETASLARGTGSLGKPVSAVAAFELSGHSAPAQLFYSMCSPSRPGTEPLRPASAGGFLSTVPPGMSIIIYDSPLPVQTYVP